MFGRAGACSRRKTEGYKDVRKFVETGVLDGPEKQTTMIVGDDVMPSALGWRPEKYSANVEVIQARSAGVSEKYRINGG